MERQKKEAARKELRSAAQGTGDRSDKIRTYNFPQVSEIILASCLYTGTHSITANKYILMKTPPHTFLCINFSSTLLL